MARTETAKTPYDLPESARKLLLGTFNLTPAPVIMLQVPACGGVGEVEFIRDMAKIVYAKNIRAGLHRKDCFSRHYAYRNLPYNGAAGDYDAFIDELRGTNPYANEYYGLDAIDVTGWAGRPCAGPGWKHLGRHLELNPTADFLLVMKTDDDAVIQSVSASLRRDFGVCVEHIALKPPDARQVVDYVLDRIHLDDTSAASLLEWLSEKAAGAPLSYAAADSLCSKISLECATPDDFEAFLAAGASGLFAERPGRIIGF